MSIFLNKSQEISISLDDFDQSGQSRLKKKKTKPDQAMLTLADANSPIQNEPNTT
jgi:hypothetical protein